MRNFITSFLIAITIYFMCSFKPAPIKVKQDSSKSQTVLLMLDSKVKSTIEFNSEFYDKLSGNTRTDSNLNVTLTIMSKYFSSLKTSDRLSYIENNYLARDKILTAIKKHNNIIIASDIITILILLILYIFIYKRSHYNTWTETIGLSMLTGLIIVLMWYGLPEILEHLINKDYTILQTLISDS